MGFRKVSIPLEIVSINEQGFHLFLNILIDGKPKKMLLDTGASRTVLDLNLFRESHPEITFETNDDLATGLGSSKVENFIATVSELRLGKNVLNDYELGLLDLSHVNESYRSLGLVPFDGVLGSDVLVQLKAVIDMEKLVLRV